MVFFLNRLDEAVRQFLMPSEEWEAEPSTNEEEEEEQQQTQEEQPLHGLGKYRSFERIDSGSFATVYKAVHKIENISYALKIINLDTRKDPQIQAHAEREFKILSEFTHPGVVRVFERFLVSQNDKPHFCIVEEFVDGCNFFDLVTQRNGLSESRALPIMKQITETLAFLHSSGVIYRDLKLENILINSSGRVKLVDFGFSKKIGTGKAIRPCGSPEYAAPELLNAERTPYSFEIDCWSLGVVLYACLQNTPPFDLSDKKKSLIEIFSRLHFPRPLSEEAQNLIIQLLQIDPRKRLTAQDALSHPWFSSQKE